MNPRILRVPCGYSFSEGRKRCGTSRTARSLKYTFREVRVKDLRNVKAPTPELQGGGADLKGATIALSTVLR